MQAQSKNFDLPLLQKITSHFRYPNVLNTSAALRVAKNA